MVSSKKSAVSPKSSFKAQAPSAAKGGISTKPDFKSAAAADVVEVAVPDQSPSEDNTSESQSKTATGEKLGKKLRRKDEILAALRTGSRVVHTAAGLYRVVAPDGSQCPTSKRRVIALIHQGLLKATEGDSRIYALDTEAEKAKREKKSAPKPEKGTTPSGNSTAK